MIHEPLWESDFHTESSLVVGSSTAHLNILKVNLLFGLGPHVALVALDETLSNTLLLLLTLDN